MCEIYLITHWSFCGEKKRYITHTLSESLITEWLGNKGVEIIDITNPLKSKILTYSTLDGFYTEWEDIIKR